MLEIGLLWKRSVFLNLDQEFCCSVEHRGFFDRQTWEDRNGIQVTLLPDDTLHSYIKKFELEVFYLEFVWGYSLKVWHKS